MFFIIPEHRAIEFDGKYFTSVRNCFLNLRITGRNAHIVGAVIESHDRASENKSQNETANDVVLNGTTVKCPEQKLLHIRMSAPCNSRCNRSTVVHNQSVAPFNQTVRIAGEFRIVGDQKDSLLELAIQLPKHL